MANPRGQPKPEGFPPEHAHVVTSLRSGRRIAEEVGDTDAITFEPSWESPREDEKAEKEDELPTCLDPAESALKAPFPHALQRRPPVDRSADILEVFQHVKMNIPLLDAIRQFPAYAKFLKDLCTHKRKARQVTKKVLLTEQVSALLQHTPPKIKDPRLPTITCQIGSHIIERALLDLGASVNLIPYSVYEKLELGELQPTPVKI